MKQCEKIISEFQDAPSIFDGINANAKAYFIAEGFKMCSDQLAPVIEALEKLVEGIEHSSIETLNSKNSKEIPTDPEDAFVYGAHIFFKLIGSSFPKAKHALETVKKVRG